MEWYETEVQALEEASIANPPPPGNVIFYGSSSIRLWSSLATDFNDVEVINLGFGGSTLAACAWFFERLVPPRQPRSIVFYAVIMIWGMVSRLKPWWPHFTRFWSS